MRRSDPSSSSPPRGAAPSSSAPSGASWTTGRACELIGPVARDIGGCGSLEVGDREGFGFVVRAIGPGGLDFEEDPPDTRAVPEAGLARWFEEQGVDLDGAADRGPA